MKKRNLWLLALFILVLSTTTILIPAVSAVTPTPVMYTLTVSPLVNCPVVVTPPGVSITTRTNFSYPAGTAVTLKANNYIGPNGSGYYFGYWSGSVTSSQNPITIIMNSNKSLTPMYAVGDPIPTPTRSPATPTPTARSATPTPGGVTVSFVIQSDWGSGCTYSVTIKNNTPNMIFSGWKLSWTFIGQQIISNIWNGTYTQSGTSVTMTGNQNINPNGGTINFGFNVSGTGRGVTNVKFNGVPVGGA